MVTALATVRAHIFQVRRAEDAATFVNIFNQAKEECLNNDQDNFTGEDHG